jgi:DNA-binding Xre family transcriptional regulator
MRLRVPELLEMRGITPYRLAKLSKGRVSLSTAYRIVRMKGHLNNFDANLLDVLCDVLDVKPGELFERKKSAR